MIKKQKVMSIGAHADDIEINTGGTLLKCRDNNYEIVYVMSTNNMSGECQILQSDGSIECLEESNVDMMARRKRECADAAAMLGATPIHLDHPQRHFKNEEFEKVELRYGCAAPTGIPANIPSILTAYENSESVRLLVELILEHNPAVIFSHGMSSASIEHLATALLTTKAYWKAIDAGFKGAMLHYREDETSFGPINAKFETFIDISDYLDEKMKLIGKHACQMPTAHHPDHGHRLRALKNGVCCHCKAAETFTWVNHHQLPDMDSALGFYSPLLAELEQNTK